MHVLHIDSCCTVQPSCQFGHHDTKMVLLLISLRRSFGPGALFLVTCCHMYAVPMLYFALACESNKAGLITRWLCYLCIIAFSNGLPGCCCWDAVLRVIRLLQERHARVHACSCCTLSAHQQGCHHHQYQMKLSCHVQICLGCRAQTHT